MGIFAPDFQELMHLLAFLLMFTKGANGKMKVPVTAKFLLEKGKIVSTQYEYVEVEKEVFINTLVGMIVKEFDLQEICAPDVSQTVDTIDKL